MVRPGLDPIIHKVMTIRSIITMLNLQESTRQQLQYTRKWSRVETNKRESGAQRGSPHDKATQCGIRNERDGSCDPCIITYLTRNYIHKSHGRTYQPRVCSPFDPVKKMSSPRLAKLPRSGGQLSQRILNSKVIVCRYKQQSQIGLSLTRGIK